MINILKNSIGEKSRVQKVLLLSCLFILLSSLIIISGVTAIDQSGDFYITSPYNDEVITLDSNVIVKWDASPNAEGYRVALRDLTTDVKMIDNVDVKNKRSYTLYASDLTPGHSYHLAIGSYGDGNKEVWAHCDFSVVAASNNPEIYSVTVTPDVGFASDDFSFVVKTNEYVDKVSITVDGYQIGSTNKFKGTNARTFTISDVELTSPGRDRVVEASAHGSNGKVVKKSTTLTVHTSPPVGVPKVTSPSSGITHYIGDSLTVKWNPPLTKPTDYNIYVHYDGNIVFEKRQHTSTSITIPASSFQSTGSYSVDIYAHLKGYAADKPGTIYITVVNPTTQTGTPNPVYHEDNPVIVEPTPTSSYYGDMEIVDLRTDSNNVVDPTPTSSYSGDKEVIDLRTDNNNNVVESTPQATQTPQKTPTPQTTPTPQATPTQQQEQSPKVFEVIASPSSATVGSTFYVRAVTNNAVDMVSVEVGGKEFGRSATFNTIDNGRTYSLQVTISEPNENCKISVYPYKNGAKVTNGGAYDIVSVNPKTEYTTSSVGYEPVDTSPDRYNPPATTETPTQLKEESGIGAFFNNIINWIKGLFSGKPEEKPNQHVYTPPTTPVVKK